MPVKWILNLNASIIELLYLKVSIFFPLIRLYMHMHMLLFDCQNLRLECVNSYNISINTDILRKFFSSGQLNKCNIWANRADVLTELFARSYLVLTYLIDNGHKVASSAKIWSSITTAEQFRITSSQILLPALLFSCLSPNILFWYSRFFGSEDY